jgi:hypothetical protein
VLNTSVINLNKDWYTQELFRDRYLQLRLFFTIFDNIKLITNYTFVKNSYTER